MRDDSVHEESAFLEGLLTSLGHVRGFVASQVIFDVLREGLLPLVGAGLGVAAIAAQKGYRAELLEATLEYLVIEDVLEKRRAPDGAAYGLTPYGRSLERYAGWFTMFVGGYGPIFGNVAKMMREGTGAAARVGEWVGAGSCLISQYDTIPLTKDFMARVSSSPRSIVDFGCGNALYLCTFCESMPEICAVGVEPSRGAYEAGVRMVRERGLEGRVSLVHCEALDYAIEAPPDFVLFGFVLHELYGQIGEEALVRYLTELGRKFSASHLIVMEVDYDIDNHAVMKAPMGRGYYNPYFLLHPFTGQKLVPRAKWVEMFARAGFELLALEEVDRRVDPSGLGIGLLLRYRG